MASFALPRRMLVLRLFVTAVIATFTSAGCSASTATNPVGTAKKLQVVAVTTIHADLVRQIAGDAAEVVSLLPPGIDPHDFEPTAADVERVARAEVIFTNGLNFETWFDKLRANAGGSAKVFELAHGVKTRTAAPHDSDEDHDGNGNDDHEDTGADPHIWQNPLNVKIMVENVRNGLNSVDNTNAAVYSERMREYVRELDTLDTWIKEQVSTIPAQHRKVITNHDAFGYYFDQYSLQLVGTVLPAFGTTSEPSAQEIAALVIKINEQKVPAIFTENTLNPKLAEQLAREAGIKVVSSLYSDALDSAGSGADTYLGMLRTNTQIIVQALR